MKKFTRVLCLVLAALFMVTAFTSCKPKDTTDDPNPDDQNKTPVYPTFADDEAIYDKVLGEFYTAYEAAKTASTVSERYALMAIAEAKLLEAGIMVPMMSKGGNYAISKVAPYTITPVLWGSDSDREHNAVVCTTPIKNTDRDALKALYKEKKGTGTYEAAAKAYLTEHGYTIKDTYSKLYSSNPETFDAFLTSNASDTEVLVNTYDGLIEYDVEGTLKPALATGWTVSEDGLKYTFTIRQGVKWVNSAKEVVGNLTADDFLAGFQHMLDDPEGGLSWLVDGIIVGVHEYINGETENFADVGVKATGTYTLEYTLTEPCSYFITMFGYSVFAPLNRAYYTSLGGKFGFGAETGTYGTDKDHIVYCGPYIITTYVASNTIVYELNDTYWNKDNINLKKITWVFTDGKIATQSYTDYKDGTIDGCGLNSAALALAKSDGVFADYCYVAGTDATSYPGFFNVYRRGFATFNDTTTLVSQQNELTKTRTALAMLNKNFRLALACAFDRGAYMEQTTGPELKYTSMVNSYTPGTFVALQEDTTVNINGTSKTYPAGTFYGAIMQDQITADGYPFKVFDTTQDGGIGSSAGYDGWYNVEAAKSYLAAAITELAAQNVEITAENPIHLDFPYQDDGSYMTARANAFKTSIEASLEGKVIIDLVATTERLPYLYSTYYFNSGDQANYNISLNSGWGPDYGDPSTYLDTMVKNGGYMLKCIGLDA